MNNKDADQTARMCRLICATVICIWHTQDFWWHGSTMASVKIQWWTIRSSYIWAASWQKQQNGMCTQQRVRSAWASAAWPESSLSAWKKKSILSYPLSAQRILWSDWVDAQADLCLRLAHSYFVVFVMRQLNYLSAKCIIYYNRSGGERWKLVIYLVCACLLF